MPRETPLLKPSDGSETPAAPTCSLVRLRGAPRLNIALYGNVRCPGRGHDIVKSHDIVGAPTISCRHDIVSPPTILLREYDIVQRSCYRVCVRYRARGAISSVRAISRVRVVISYASSRYRGRGVVSCLPALS